MRVLISAFQCAPDLGSEPGTGWHWATSLADLGHEVTVLTLDNYRGRIEAGGRDDIDFRFIERMAPRATMALVRATSPQIDMYDTYARWQIAAFRHVTSQAAQFDVAHHVVWGGLHFGSQLWRLPIPFIYGPIGGGQTAPTGYLRYFGRDVPMELARTAMTGPMLARNSRCRDTVRNSAVTLVCNSATEHAVRRLGARDVRYMLADGLAQDWVTNAPRLQPGGVPKILFVGRLLTRKAPVLAVEAFAMLRRMMPARLIIAGDGPLAGRLRAAIGRLGIASDVDLLGAVPLSEVKLLYDSASVLLFPSLRESFGAPYLEAMGRALPSVALDLNGIADADVGDATIKVALPTDPSRLPGQIANALRDILTDGAWSARSEAALKYAANWSWPAKAAMATSIYNELTSLNYQQKRDTTP